MEAKNNIADRKKSSRLKGMKLRDEFLCPITYELLREPMVALDGHTYEKSAIEKWFKSKRTSPLNGEPISDTMTIPNVNMKKLIQDLITEGGVGLYTSDDSYESRCIDVYTEKVLVLKCLGPPESEWNNQRCEVTHIGCIGGRKQQDAETLRHGQEMVLFKDSTVSRKHFEIRMNQSGKYEIRDLGSAGGTFIRIAFGQKKQLHPGMMILFGKHQFNVSSIEDLKLTRKGSSIHLGGTADAKKVDALGSKKVDDLDSKDSLKGKGNATTDSVASSAVLKDLVYDAEQLIEDLAQSRLEDNGGEIERRLRALTSRLNSHMDAKNDGDEENPMDQTISPAAFKSEGDGSSAGEKNASASARGSKIEAEEEDETGAIGAVVAPGKDVDFDSDNEAADKAQMGSKGMEPAQKRCTLTCFTPDGSPLQGKSFMVGCEGATIGRRPTNQISLYVKVEDPDAEGGEKMMNIDTAVSAEHAQVEYDERSGAFCIKDGVSKPSTNGTWFRLSGPHQESPFFQLEPGMEVLIGTIRFEVSENLTIAERVVSQHGSMDLSGDGDAHAPGGKEFTIVNDQSGLNQSPPSAKETG